MSMSTALRITAKDFESSSGRTSQYLKWHRMFKREFTHELKSRGCTDVQISKPNHFDMSGFFTYKEHIAYFSVSDLRWSKDKILLRRANSYEDYTGGHNCYVSLKEEYEFGVGLATFLDGLSWGKE